MKRERVAQAKFKKEREREEAILREREEREVGGVCVRVKNISTVDFHKLSIILLLAGAITATLVFLFG